jgi:uncharacterized protein YdaU (DUF1376 family)
MKEIKHVQLEAGAFISDTDFQMMTAEQRGIYFSVILYLYSNGGKLVLNDDNDNLISGSNSVISLISNCPKSGEEWNRVWEPVRKKFKIKNKILTHKRVSREMKKAYNYWKNKSLAGKKGMQQRYNSDRCDVITKERKGKETKGKERKENFTNTNERALSLSASLRFAEQLDKVIMPKTKSDRTALLNLCQWLMVAIKEGRFNEGVYDDILTIAESSKGRNPIAVFFSRLDQEVGYRAKAERTKK